MFPLINRIVMIHVAVELIVAVIPDFQTNDDKDLSKKL